MTTKKFSTFEYAAVAGSDKPGAAGIHCQDVFETPMGHAFVVVADENATSEGAELCEVALQRIRYYMEHEPEEEEKNVIENALIYTSGYVFQHYNKDKSEPLKGLSCLCVLFVDGRIYYSWVGDVGLYLFTGKQLYWLTCPDPKKSGSDTVERTATKDLPLLGQQAIIAPFSNGDAPLKPINGDKLLLTSGSVGKQIHTKATKRILKDSMPLKTKVNRILRDVDPADQSGALIMLRFHAVDNKERFIAADSKVPPTVQTPKSENVSGEKKAKTHQKTQMPYFQIALWVLGFLVVSYFVYDLFIDDPHPPVAIEIPQPEVGPQETIHVPEEVVEEAETPPALPEDVVYTVRSGDTWGRIYGQFGVCSWFIINHPGNRGKFGRENTLIAGERLQIPVRYSGDPEQNPYYYTHFTSDKVGDGCRNVNRAFLEAFEEAIQP